MPRHLLVGEGTGTGHVVEDETSALPTRSKLSFQGAGVGASDDSANNRTVITIPGGGGVGGGIPPETINAKGDLLVGTAADTVGRLGVGTNNQVLTADSAQVSGVRWATAPSTGDPAGTAAAAVATHEADTTAVHGITSTTQLVQACIHNGTVYPTRPVNALVVIWIGPTDPGASASNNDLWIPTG